MASRCGGRAGGDAVRAVMAGAPEAPVQQVGTVDLRDGLEELLLAPMCDPGIDEQLWVELDVERLPTKTDKNRASPGLLRPQTDA